MKLTKGLRLLNFSGTSNARFTVLLVGPLPLASAIVIEEIGGGLWLVLQWTQGFRTEYCIVMTLSILFTSPVNPFNVLVGIIRSRTIQPH